MTKRSPQHRQRRAKQAAQNYLQIAFTELLKSSMPARLTYHLMGETAWLDAPALEAKGWSPQQINRHAYPTAGDWRHRLERVLAATKFLTEELKDNRLSAELFNRNVWLPADAEILHNTDLIRGNDGRSNVELSAAARDTEIEFRKSLSRLSEGVKNSLENFPAGISGPGRVSLGKGSDPTPQEHCGLIVVLFCEFKETKIMKSASWAWQMCEDLWREASGRHNTQLRHWERHLCKAIEFSVSFPPHLFIEQIRSGFKLTLKPS
jgi:hypothetical protein